MSLMVSLSTTYPVLQCSALPDIDSPVCESVPWLSSVYQLDIAIMHEGPLAMTVQCTMTHGRHLVCQF